MFLGLLGMQIFAYKPVNVPDHSGVWISTHGSALLTLFPGYKKRLEEQVDRVYIDVYTNGTTFISRAPWDPLGALQHLDWHENSSYTVYAWFQDGLSLDSLNNTTKDLVFDRKIRGKYWLDISKPRARMYILGIMRDFVSTHPHITVHLDDHWAVPKEFGDFSNELTDLTERVVNITGPVSVSGLPLGYTRREHNIDWHTWCKKGFLKEFVLQNYVPAHFEYETEVFLRQTNNWSIPTSVGIYGGAGLKERNIASQISYLQGKNIEPVLFPWKAFYF